MDKRDKHLNRHMQLRKQLAQRLSIDKQYRWAHKCVERAHRQHRCAFYLMARMWLANLTDASGTMIYQ